MNKNWIIGGVILVVVIGLLVWKNSAPVSDTPIKIGVLTDLTGPAAAYWGESSQAGAELAIRDLRAKGYNVEAVYEDYALDASKAASAVQKLLNINKVDALYVEFNPAALAVAPIVKEKNLLMVYDAAIVSPLEQSPNFFKTYLDYQAGCRAIAEKFKSEGEEAVGMLKINLEAGELCLRGVQEVYSNVVVETFNLGDTDFRTQLLKLKNAGVTVVIDVGFEGDIYNLLKTIKEAGLTMKLGSVDDSVTPNTANSFPEQLSGAWTFGFKAADESFASRVDAVYGKTYPTYWGASLAYTHVTDIVESLAACNKEVSCASQKMTAVRGDALVGFRGFEDRIAELEMQIKQY